MMYETCKIFGSHERDIYGGKVLDIMNCGVQGEILGVRDEDI